MAKVVVIGATGHIGSSLTPRLVEAGHEVTAVSRGNRGPYHRREAWSHVSRLNIDRCEADEAGAFGGEIAQLKPEVVMDLICYRPESCRQIVEALRGKVRHYLQCGSIWVHGPGVEAPARESAPYRPTSDYGRFKAEIEAYLVAEAVRGFPATVIHPGHISGPGWVPINPAGNLNLEVFTKLACGEPLALANFGLETLHHVHADDVAAIFVRAMERPGHAIGQAFHAVSPAALTCRGYAEQVARCFGQEARLTFLPFEEWRKGVSEEDAAITLDHLEKSPNCSMEKAKRLLDFTPRYSSLETIHEALQWLEVHGQWRPCDSHAEHQERIDQLG